MIDAYSNEPTAEKLLAQGYVFRNADGYVDKTTPADGLTEVTVVACDHNGENGFDINSTACPYCGAPAVVYTQLNLPESAGNSWRKFADLQTALDSDRLGGSVVRLLADVSGDYTIDGTQVTGLDLNGHSINGTVYVTGGGKDTTFSNSQSTGTVGTVVASAGAKLAGSGAPAIIGRLTLADGATWANILRFSDLGYKVYTNYPDLTAYTWYAPADVTGTELNNVTIGSLPIASSTLYLKVNGKNVSSVERGTTVQLCAYCNTSGATVAFRVGERKNDGYNYFELSGDKVEYKKIGSTWYYVAEYTFSERGGYNIYFTAIKEGYSATSEDKTLTVTKASIPAAEITAPTAITGLVYNGTAQELVTPGSVDAEYGEMQYSLYSARGFSTEIPIKTDAGTYRVYYKVVGSSEYKDSGSKSFRVTIAKKALTLEDVTVADKIYDGTTDAAITGVTFAGLVNGDTLTFGTDYTVTGTFDNANAVDRKSVTATVTLKTSVKNYSLNGSSVVKGGCTIKKAAAPAAESGTLYVYNDLAKTYEVDLPALPELDSPKTYGDNISYNWPGSSLSKSYYNSGIEIKPGKLSLPILKNSTKTEGLIGTAYVTITTDNYEDFKLEINVFAKNRIEPTVQLLQASDITYGQSLSESTLSFVYNGACDPTTGNPVEGELRWKDGSIVPGTTDNDNWYEYEFIPAASYDGIYAAVTGNVYVKVNPAELTGVSVEQTGTLTYNTHKQRADVTAQATAVNGQQVTFTYSAEENGTYSAAVPAFMDAGTYTVYYKASAPNHVTATGSFTVTIDPIKIDHVMFAKDISKTHSGEAEFSLTNAERSGCLKFYGENSIPIAVPDSGYAIAGGVRFVEMTADGTYVDSPAAGNKKYIQFTVNLYDKNYVLQSQDETEPVRQWLCTQAWGARFTITKAAAPAISTMLELHVTNGIEKTYELDLGMLLPEQTLPREYGTVTYGLPSIVLSTDYYDASTAKIENGKLLLPIKAADSNVGSLGEVTVEVSSTNYETFELTIPVFSKDKLVPVLDGTVSAADITYGQTLADSTLTVAGAMKCPLTGEKLTGTFAWKNPDTVPNAGDYEAEWTFTPDASYGGEYVAVTGKVTVKVDPKSIVGAVVTLEEDSFVYDGTVKEPKIKSVILDGVTLVYNGRDGDYGFAYNRTSEVGTYNDFIVGGQNNYTGEIKLTWSITPRTVTAPTVTVSGAPFIYTSSAFTPEITVTDDLGNVIDPKEYSVSYRDNTNAGTATIIITDNAGGNYIVSGSKTFTIEKAASAIVTAPAAKTGLVYNGTEQDLITAGEATGGTVKYRLGDTGEFGAAIPKAANAGEYTVYYYVEGDANHRNYEVQSLTVTIAKATVTVTAANKSAFAGDPAPDLSRPAEGTDYTVSGLFGGDKLTGTVKLAYVDASGKEMIPNMAMPGETIIRASGVTAPNGNYNVVFEDGRLTVSVRLYYTITATAGVHGSISPSGSVSVIHGRSQSFTIAPEAGYAIANVRIDGVSIGAVRYYTFENVTSTHTIEAVFMRVNGNPQTGVMVDETDGSYYESAWQGE